MTNYQTTEHEGTALETEIWLPLKEASDNASCHTATIKRAIKNGKLDGRKVGEEHNASYEVAKVSFDRWLKTKNKLNGIGSQIAAAPTEPAPTEPEADCTKVVAKPKLTKDERHKLKAARKKEIPESARRLRRWKNFMRHATQEQSLAMIKWLSARLTPKKSLQKKILKEALTPAGTQTLNPS